MNRRRDLLEAAHGFADALELLEHPGHADQSVHGNWARRTAGKLKRAVTKRTREPAFNPSKTKGAQGTQEGSHTIDGKKVSAKEYVRASKRAKGDAVMVQPRGSAYTKMGFRTKGGRVAMADIPDFGHKAHRGEAAAAAEARRAERGKGKAKKKEAKKGWSKKRKAAVAAGVIGAGLLAARSGGARRLASSAVRGKKPGGPGGKGIKGYARRTTRVRGTVTYRDPKKGRQVIDATRSDYRILRGKKR